MSAALVPASPTPAAAPRLTAATSRFNIFERGKFCQQPVSYSRRDFYKIALMTGTGQLTYATRAILLERPALMFPNSRVPYSWEPPFGRARRILLLIYRGFSEP